MGVKEEMKMYFEYTLGNESHLNLFGKIIFGLPIILIGIIGFGLSFVVNLLFTKKSG